MIDNYGFIKQTSLKYKNSNSKNIKAILVVLENLEVLENFKNLILDNKDTVWYIYLTDYDFKNDNELIRNFYYLLKREDVVFINNFIDAVNIIPSVGLILSESIIFDAANLKAMAVARVASKLSIKYLGLQCKIFQKGINIESSIKYKIFSNGLVLFDDIGFPNYHNINKEPLDGSYTLISLDLEDFILTEEDKVNFYSAVFNLIRQQKSEKFIIKYNQLKEDIIKDIFTNNCFNIVINPEFITTEELVRNSSSVIAYTTNILMLAEIYSKNTLVYKSTYNKELLDALAMVKSFSNKEELNNHFNSIKNNPDYLIKTGLIKEFDVTKYEEILNSNYKETELDGMKIVDILIDNIAIFTKDNDELQNDINIILDKLNNNLNLLKSVYNKLKKITLLGRLKFLIKKVKK